MQQHGCNVSCHGSKGYKGDRLAREKETHEFTRVRLKLQFLSIVSEPHE